MATPNRAALLTKAHKILKKHYKPVNPVERPLLGQLLYALCLENSSHEGAEKALADLQSGFFDWNEVRVSTVNELAELMGQLRDPRAQAACVKRTLQSVFESTYSFELDALKKKNLGQAVKDLEKLPGVTPFAVAYVTQTSLGGHAIPLDKGAFDAFVVLGIATEKEVASGAVPGVERAIPKNKGFEFGSLLHQLGVDLLAKPFSNDVREIFISIAADAKDRLPKRGVKKPEPAPRPPVETKAEKPAAAAGKPATQPPGKSAPAPAIAKKKDKEVAKPEPTAKKPTPKKTGDVKKAVDAKKPKTAEKKPADKTSAGSKKLAKSKPR
jgi:endonuclease III